MALPLLVAGLVLWLAGGGWFDSATTVGQILTAVGAVLIVIQLLFVAGVGFLATRR
jgi:hypothetical protein